MYSQSKIKSAVQDILGALSAKNLTYVEALGALKQAKKKLNNNLNSREKAVIKEYQRRGEQS